MLWPHLRHVGIRFMALLHVCGAGHVARAEQGAARAVKDGARRAKHAHTAMWAWRTLTACATMQLAGNRACMFPERIVTCGASGLRRGQKAAWSDHQQLRPSALREAPAAHHCGSARAGQRVRPQRHFVQRPASHARR